MEVFHYCAVKLKDKPIFETCSNENIPRAGSTSTGGAVYNDFDGNPGALLRDSDFDEEHDNDSSDHNQASENEQDITISQEEVDHYFLLADEEDQTRWVKDHPLFSQVKNDEFDEKVRELEGMSEDEWNRLPIYIIDLKR